MTRCFALLLILSLTLLPSLLLGQTRPATTGVAPVTTAPAAGGTQVALIDLGYILRNHPGHLGNRETLKEKAKTMTNQETAIRQQLQAESDKLKDFQPGSLEYKQLEGRLAQQASDFQLQAKLDRRAELAEEEAKMLFETYAEVQQVIQRLADGYGIGLVIRFERDRMDPADPDSISRGLMNPVVFHQRGLDITELVLKELKPAAAGVARPPLNRPLR